MTSPATATDLAAMFDRANDRVSAVDIRADAIKAIRALETKLKAANGLRGMHNLGSRDVPIMGMRIRGLMPDQRIPFEER